MRYKTFIISLITALFIVPAVLADAASIHASNIDVRNLLTSLAASDNINILINDDVTGNISINLNDISPHDAIKTIAQMKNLICTEENGVIFICSKQSNNQNFNSLHIFKIKYADLKILAATIKMYMQQNANPPAPIKDKNNNTLASVSITIDADNNSLLFYGTTQQAAALKAFINKIDIPCKQVMLEAKVIAIQKDATKNLGIEWNWSELPQYPQISESYQTIEHSVVNNAGNYQTISENIPHNTVTRNFNGSSNIPGIIQFGKGPEGVPFEFYYGAKINALVTDGKASVLAKPNIIAQNNHEAVINIGGSVPIPKLSTTDSTTTTSYDYHETGIILRYTPRINNDNYITASIHTEVSSPIYIADLKAYRFQTRSADTVVRLKDGETMVIGGLIGSEEAKSMSKIPFLGDLPIIGHFFRNIKNSKTQSEIVIFLTAHIKKSPLAAKQSI